MGCTFSKGVAPQPSLSIVCRQKDDVGNIEVKKKSQTERGKTALVELEKVDDRIDRELSENLSAKQEIEAEKPNEASMKLKSTSDEEASLSFNWRIHKTLLERLQQALQKIMAQINFPVHVKVEQ